MAKILDIFNGNLHGMPDQNGNFSSPALRELQSELQRLRLYDGEIDNEFNHKTASALAQYFSDNPRILANMHEEALKTIIPHLAKMGYPMNAALADAVRSEEINLCSITRIPEDNNMEKLVRISDYESITELTETFPASNDETVHISFSLDTSDTSRNKELETSNSSA